MKFIFLRELFRIKQHKLKKKSVLFLSCWHEESEGRGNHLVILFGARERYFIYRFSQCSLAVFKNLISTAVKSLKPIIIKKHQYMYILYVMVSGPLEIRFSIDSIPTEFPLDKNYNMYLFKCRCCSSKSNLNGFYEFLRETIRTHLKNRLLRVSAISHYLRPQEPVPSFSSPSFGRHRVFVT